MERSDSELLSRITKYTQVYVIEVLNSKRKNKLIMDMAIELYHNREVFIAKMEAKAADYRRKKRIARLMKNENTNMSKAILLNN